MGFFAHVRVMLTVAVLTVALPGHSHAGTAPSVGVAGVPLQLAAPRDYHRTFALLAEHGINLFFPIFMYVEAPEPASLGYEVDFVPPCRSDEPSYEALRAHGVRLIVPAALLYDHARSLPPIEQDPLAALIACAGRENIYGVLSFDEPAHSEISPAATAALYNRIKNIAADMPVLMVHAPLKIEPGASAGDDANLGYLASVKEHSRNADIVGFDTYPIPMAIAKVGAPGAGELVVDEATAVRSYLEFIKQVAPGKRYLSVIQNFSPADQYSPAMLETFPPELVAMARAPSTAEMETMMRESIENGADVIIWFGGAFTKSEDAPQWRATLDVSARAAGDQ